MSKSFDHDGSAGVPLDPKKHWMDVWATETLLPFSGWNQMVPSISSRLASQIRPHLTKPEFRQMVFQLLGSEFVSKHLNDLPTYPAILQPSYMSSSTFHLLQIDTFRWLQKQLTIACKQLNIPFRIGSVDLEKFNYSFDFDQFFEHTCGVAQESIVRECLVKGQQKSFDFVWWRSGTGIKCQSDVIGDGLLKICLNSPASFVARQSQFIGYGLPEKLQAWAWKFLLELFYYSSQVDQKPLDKLYLASHHINLSQMFKRKVENLRAIRNGEDSIDGLIRKTIKQVFLTYPSLIEAAGDKSHLPSYCATTLSLLHYHGYKFEYTNVLLAVPLIMTIEYPSMNDPFPLVAYLSVFMDTCLPSADHMKNIAHRVCTHLSNYEAHLYTHINTLLQSTGDITLLAELSLPVGNAHYTVTLDSFVHKWISLCFVEILNLKTLLFVWDQLFLSDWAYSMIEDLCVALLKILKTSLLDSSSAASLRKVLLVSTQLITEQELSKMIRK